MLSVRLTCVAISLTASAALVAEPSFAIALSSSQKQAFVAAVLHCDQLRMEEQLPRRLSSLHAFKPYFDMSELASAAYALVLESPRDKSRWRALAKIAAYDDGEYAGPYEFVRQRALAKNPRLFSYCPQFTKWVETARHGENI
jgi:hypothetical protein